jgi:hypothetical protein
MRKGKGEIIKKIDRECWGPGERKREQENRRWKEGRMTKKIK